MSRKPQVYSPTYSSWRAMRSRCNYTKNAYYARYGGRGIKVCERWNSFQNFLADMGPRPLGTTLERKDRNGNYEPGNCVWATAREQMRNTSCNVVLTHKGRTQTLTDWAIELRVNRQMLYARVNRNGASSPKVFAGLER
jgi:hypothetical protein